MRRRGEGDPDLDHGLIPDPCGLLTFPGLHQSRIKQRRHPGQAMKISKTRALFIPGFVIMVMALSGRIVAAPEEQAVTEGMKNRAAAIPSESRRLALETAGAFVNDGFRIRDGEWGGILAKGTPLLLQVTLFAGESYWFVAASPMRGGVFRVTLYDSSGKRMKG